MSAHWSDKLRRLGACPEAVEWARAYETYEAAWAACDRGDWMLWIAGRFAGPPGDPLRIPLVRATCECARQSLHLVPAGGERPRRVIETAEAWTRGEASLEEVRKAAHAAYAASAADATDAAAYAAYAAADAAAAAWHARADSLAESAEIVRKHYPQPPKLGVR